MLSTPFELKLNGAVVTDTIRNLIAGTYELKISDANDCSITQDLIIDNSDNEAPTVLTKNDTVFLNEDGFTFLNPMQFNAGSFDDCDTNNLQFRVNPSRLDCTQAGQSIPITLSVTDGANQTSTGTASAFRSGYL